MSCSQQSSRAIYHVGIKSCLKFLKLFDIWRCEGNHEAWEVSYRMFAVSAPTSTFALLLSFWVLSSSTKWWGRRWEEILKFQVSAPWRKQKVKCISLRLPWHRIYTFAKWKTSKIVKHTIELFRKSIFLSLRNPTCSWYNSPPSDVRWWSWAGEKFSTIILNSLSSCSSTVKWETSCENRNVFSYTSAVSDG